MQKHQIYGLPLKIFAQPRRKKYWNENACDHWRYVTEEMQLAKKKIEAVTL